MSKRERELRFSGEREKVKERVGEERRVKHLKFKML